MGPDERPASRCFGRTPLISEYVTGNYFSTLGVRAYGGRLITPDDDTPASAPAAVLSHRAWETVYGADPTVVGSTFTVEQHPFTIVGVTPLVSSVTL